MLGNAVPRVLPVRLANNLAKHTKLRKLAMVEQLRAHCLAASQHVRRHMAAAPGAALGAHSPEQAILLEGAHREGLGASALAVSQIRVPTFAPAKSAARRLA